MFFVLIRRLASITIAVIRPRAIRDRARSAYASKPSSWIVRLSFGSVDNVYAIPDMRPMSDINNTLSRDMVWQRHVVSTIMLNFAICMNKVVLFTIYIEITSYGNNGSIAKVMYFLNIIWRITILLTFCRFLKSQSYCKRFFVLYTMVVRNCNNLFTLVPC